MALSCGSWQPFIRADGRYLLCRRPRHKRHGGCWEFPGGKLEPGETLLDAAKRELREELGLDVTGVGEPLLCRRDGDSPFLIEFVPVDVQGAPRPLEHEEVRWVGANEGTALLLAPSDAVFWKEWVSEGLSPFAQDTHIRGVAVDPVAPSRGDFPHNAEPSQRLERRGDGRHREAGGLAQACDR